ncbi:MAG: hypothetical protein IPO44_15400 [Candidatus Microthrix sp.]|nr:hypothetical protein [Candidatus Microthrix sp.]MBK9560872.1 hypothetical protein [Candidatus Microthrix sp.]
MAKACDESRHLGGRLLDHVVHPRQIFLAVPLHHRRQPRFKPQTAFVDPFPAIAAIGAVTAAAAFFPNIYVLPLRHPPGVAKQLA